MNRLDDTHPALDQLVAFSIGDVRGEAATAIEEHLSQCSTCCDVVAKPSVDELVRLVRTSKGGRKANQPSLRLQPGYEILEELGRGGMGVVYKARQAGLHRLVALKRALSGGDAEEFVRFRREAEAAARLHHPNIVQIYEVGEQDGVPYLAMEYVEGGTLAAHLDGTPVAPRVTAELVATVARAMHHAHQHGVVHRDLKPENVLLSFSREPVASASAESLATGSRLKGVVPKIADFGLAKLLDKADGKTRTGAILGTPKYMAPEQATGASEQIGPATDVHALGVLLYEMLTGRVPYAGATILETLEQVCSHEPATPRRLQPGVPRELETICLRALAKEPARRYASAAALAEDLTRFLDGRPILARPAGSFERLYKAIRRRPAWATLVSLAVLMVLGSVGGVLYHNAQLREQVERADTHAANAIQEKERADTQYQQARLTLLRMLEALEKKGAESIPQVLELRRAQSEQALAFFESIGAGEVAANPRQRADLAAACKEAARLQIALGRHAPAEQNLRRAIRLLEDLNVEAADEREPRETLAACFDFLGVLLSRDLPGRGEEAVSCGRKAVALSERLVRDFPTEVRLKHNLAHACDNLGTLYRTHPGGSVVELYERSLNLLRELHRAQPDQVEFAVGLAQTCSNLGSVYWGNQQLDKAAAVYQEALGILEPLAGAHPGHVWYASSLASLRINLGGLWLTRGRAKEALQQYDRALAALQDILSREPNHAQAQNDLLPAHGGRAQTLSRLGRHAESVKDWDRVVALAPPANRPAFRLERAGVLIQAGDLAKAAAEADEVAGAAKVEAVYLYEAGYLHARIASALTSKPSEAEAHAGRAVAWLQKACNAGFFKKPDQAAYLKHPNFSILRSRADYQNLLRAVTEALPKEKQ